MMSLPVSLPGPMLLLWGSLSLVPCSFWEGLCLGEGSLSMGVSVREKPPPRTAVKSGRYASYWNAFLYFSLVSDEQNKGDKIPQKIFKCPHISM